MLRGTRVGQAYIAVTADGDGINEGIVDAVDEAGKDMDSRGEKHGEDYGEGFSDGALDRIRDKLSNGLSRLGMGKAGDDSGREFSDNFERHFDNDFMERIGARVGGHLVDALNFAISREGGDNPLADLVDRLMDDAVSGNGSGGRGGKGGTGDFIGRLFGAGSRNNFLNALGKSIGGVVSLTEKAGQFAGTFAENMSKAGEGASFISRIMSGFGGSGGGGAAVIARLGAVAPLAVAGITAVVVAMSAMISVVGALVGILTALVSTIVSGLVGALAIVGPAIGAVAVAGGLLVAAFTSMTEAQRKYMSDAFIPVKEGMTGIGQIIMTEFVKPLYDSKSAVQVWSENIQQAMLPLAGVAKETASAFAVSGNIITQSLSGPGFQKFFTSLGSELPKIVVSLSRALGGFLNGVGAMFAAIMPFVTRFADYLDRTATRFSEWANSGRGQNSIVDFVGRAIESFKSLWNFTREFFGFFSDVFFNRTSQQAGNSIFDSLASAFAGFRRAFQKAAQSGDLERWFNDAIEFGGQLWGVVKALFGVFMSLYNSGVLSAVGGLLDVLAQGFQVVSMVLTPVIDALGYVLPRVLAVAISPIVALAAALLSLGEVVEWLGGLVGIGNGSEGILKPFEDANNLLNNLAGFQMPAGMGPIMGPIAPGLPGNYQLPDYDFATLQSSGNAALNQTYESHGGYLPDPKDPTKGPKKNPEFEFDADAALKEWENPYKEFAARMLAKSEDIVGEVRKATRAAREAIAESLNTSVESFRKLLTDFGKSLNSGVTEAVASTDYKAVQESFTNLISSVRDSAYAAVDTAAADAQTLLDTAGANADAIVATAQSAYETALRAVGSATNPAELKAAQKTLDKASKDLALARQKADGIRGEAFEAANQMIANANASTGQVERAAAILAGQSVFTYDNALNLARGLKVENATLADYAEARRWAAERLAEANQKLSEAINIRDSYSNSVAESIRTFGTLLSAQAKVIDGVQQALTTSDIVESMQARLDKVKTFQSNLRLLLAQGLSDAAYKQLVDAGVENGGAYAAALVEGGQGGISEINNLTEQFNQLGEELGLSASNQLYQAGVDAAQGLVDGLTSLSAELDSAAAALGAAIAAAIKRELGIASPSRVLMSLMDDVGDGTVIGLDNQHDKVGAASARLSEQIAVSPEVANYAASQGSSPTTSGFVEGEVSGNGEGTVYAGKIRDLIIHTPTEDPHAVATEVLDEIVEQL